MNIQHFNTTNRHASRISVAVDPTWANALLTISSNTEGVGINVHLTPDDLATLADKIASALDALNKAAA